VKIEIQTPKMYFIINSTLKKYIHKTLNEFQKHDVDSKDEEMNFINPK
jgi:hypothetical protein